jgi:release factor glutamine methyltransferase
MTAHVSVLEVIQRSTEYLAQRGVESPRLQVELILAHVLRMPRLKLYLEFNRPLSEAEASDTRSLVKRRGQREPLQYLLGSTSFCGLEIEVNPHVLIPRPETEFLAERAWTLLKERADETPPLVLDLCTGSGCLAIAIASHCPSAMIHAIDISDKALDVARRNAQRHGFADRIMFFQGDVFHAPPRDAKFDLIVSNPPYIPTADVSTLQPEVRDHEPMGALDGGPDGLSIIRRIANEAPGHMLPGGWLALEFSDGQGDALRKLFALPPWTEVSIEKDFSRRERILIARAQIS